MEKDSKNNINNETENINQSINGNKLWKTILNYLQDSKLPKISAISISCHRNSFVFWDKSIYLCFYCIRKSGKCISSVNTWQNKNSEHVASKLNSSFKIKVNFIKLVFINFRCSNL